MGIVRQPVEKSVGDGGIAHHLMPVLNRQLACYDRRCRSMPVFNDLERVSSLGIGERCKTEVVKEQDRRFCQLCEEPGIAAVGPCDGESVMELGCPDIEGAEAFPAHLVGEGTREVGLPLM